MNKRALNSSKNPSLNGEEDGEAEKVREWKGGRRRDSMYNNALRHTVANGGTERTRKDAGGVGRRGDSLDTAELVSGVSLLI